jgi:hypothetical protein
MPGVAGAEHSRPSTSRAAQIQPPSPIRSSDPAFARPPVDGKQRLPAAPLSRNDKFAMPITKPLAARVYHMTEAANWPLIERHGLLSTSHLLDLAGVAGVERITLERRHRTRAATLPNGAVIRDQAPMPPEALARCLRGGIAPEDWYAELNRRVFFWVDPARLNRQRRACGATAQMVLIVDAPAMLARHGSRAALTAFNTGNARRKPAPRGRATFVPYADWLESRWSSEAAALGIRARQRSHAPVELAILDAIADIADFIVEVRRLEPGELFEPRA